MPPTTRVVVFLVCIAVGLLTATATASITAQELSAISCNECQDIVSIVYGIADSPIALNTTVEVLVEICDAKFANDTKLKDDCVLLMKLAGGLIPLLFDAMNDFAWNIPLTFCADVAKVCVEPCCTAGAPPQEVFINFADSSDLSQIRATWITLNDTEGAGVEWWVSGGSAAPQTAKEATRTYTAGGWIGVIHSALMTGLLPDTQYSYRVGSSWHGWSANLTFRTLPTVIGVPSRPLRVLQLADMGSTPKATPTVELINKLVDSGKVDFIIHNGDIGYANGDEQRWDLYMNKIQNFSSRVPYMTAPGNHELYMNFTAYQTRMRAGLPVAQPSAAEGNMYYGLTVGPVEFVFLNSETWIDTGDLDPQQIQWFHAHMSTVNRQKTPFVTVTQHRPLYCAACVNDWNSLLLRNQSEAALNQWKVDVHITGHVHDYQRMYAIKNGEIVSKSYNNPTAPVYVLNGAGGNVEGQDQRVTQDFVAYGTTDYGVGLLEYSVDATTSIASMQYSFYNAATQEVVDQFTLTKDI